MVSTAVAYVLPLTVLLLVLLLSFYTNKELKQQEQIQQLQQLQQQQNSKIDQLQQQQQHQMQFQLQLMHELQQHQHQYQQQQQQQLQYKQLHQYLQHLQHLKHLKHLQPQQQQQQMKYEFEEREPRSSLHLSDDLVEYNKTLWCPDVDYPFLTILTDCCQWKAVEDPTNATILWTVAKSDMVSDITPLALGRGQLWNQLPSGASMTDKSRLHQLLVHMNVTHFQPLTYVFTDSEECVSFFRKAHRNDGTVWIAKDPLMAEGESIKVNPDIDELRKKWLVDPNADDDHIECQELPDELVTLVQEYILNPLLLKGKKMEIRSYWMVASVEPFVVLYYREGTVRLTTSDYYPSDWDNPLIHITNTLQQKKANPNYYLTESERKWTLLQLAHYLYDENVISEDPVQWLEGLRAQLKHIIAVCAAGAYPHLYYNKEEGVWDGRFELFGMDVILDDTLRPWMTEIQDGPSLSLDPGMKQVLIPQMLKELTDVMLEVDYYHRFEDHFIPSHLRSTDRWEILDALQFVELE